MRTRPAVFLLLALVSAALPVAAQPYTRSPADTLRYREVTVDSSEVTTPDGTLPLASLHDARMAVAFGAADSARAWYEVLEIRAWAPGQQREPATTGALHRPFVLRFGPRGDVEVLSAPRFPAEFEGITDLTKQFDDYFVPLPARPLEPGYVWTDTVALRDSTTEGVSAFGFVRHHRVRGDSTVDGERVLVIATRAQLAFEQTEAGESPATTFRTVLVGEEEGTVLWSATRGVLVGRERRAELRGAMELLGTSLPVKFPIRRRYRSSLQLLR
jgi:hypothetical protein